MDGFHIGYRVLDELLVGRHGLVDRHLPVSPALEMVVFHSHQLLVTCFINNWNQSIDQKVYFLYFNDLESDSFELHLVRVFRWEVLLRIRMLSVANLLAKCYNLPDILLQYHGPKVINRVWLWTLCRNDQAVRLFDIGHWARVSFSVRRFYVACINVLAFLHLIKFLCSRQVLIVGISIDHCRLRERCNICVYVALFTFGDKVLRFVPSEYLIESTEFLVRQIIGQNISQRFRLLEASYLFLKLASLKFGKRFIEVRIR